MNTTCFWIKSAGVLAAFVVAAGAAYAQTDAGATKPSVVTRAAKPATGAAVTLVGRGNRAAEVRKDGTVTELAPSQLVFVNKGKGMMDWFSAPAPAPAPALPPDDQDEQKDPIEEIENAAREEGQKAVEEALRDADKRTIQDMRKGRYMWFFDEKGKEMTNEELDRRLASGDLSGIKAVNDDRDEWTPRSESVKKD